ncbi:MAG TPA: EamA family transporter, partial [Candidatus Saccharimonadales bacterium]|nr:EamA family transporter [Candidatus Saccharimonadales bacterium]
MSSRTGVVAAFLAIYLIWGSTYLAIRFAVETIPPFLMAGARYSIAGILLYGWLWMRGERRTTPRQWRDA